GAVRSNPRVRHRLGLVDDDLYVVLFRQLWKKVRAVIRNPGSNGGQWRDVGELSPSAFRDRWIRASRRRITPVLHRLEAPLGTCIPGESPGLIARMLYQRLSVRLVGQPSFEGIGHRLVRASVEECVLPADDFGEARGVGTDDRGAA